MVIFATKTTFNHSRFILCHFCSWDCLNQNVRRNRKKTLSRQTNKKLTLIHFIGIITYHCVHVFVYAEYIIIKCIFSFTVHHTPSVIINKSFSFAPCHTLSEKSKTERRKAFFLSLN